MKNKIISAFSTTSGVRTKTTIVLDNGNVYTTYENVGYWEEEKKCNTQEILNK